MELLRPPCGNNTKAHDPHHYWAPGDLSEGTACQGWSAEQADTTGLILWLHGYVAETTADGLKPELLPEGIRLEVNPGVYRALINMIIPSPSELSQGRTGLPPQVPLLVEPALPLGGWRLAATIRKGVIGDGMGGD